MLIATWLPTVAQDTPGYFVEASVDKAAPFVGEQVRYTFRLYDAVALDNPLYEPPPFEGFWRIDLGDVSQTTQMINSQTYTVTELRTTLFPTRSGEIVIDPARLVLPPTVFEAERQLLSNPVVLQVRSLPGGAPAGFGGAVGHFTMEASIDRDRVQVGEPIALELSVTGDGNVEQLPAPLVTLPSRWRLVENPTRFTAAVENGVVIGSKTFHFALLAATAGIISIEPIIMYYFDPLSTTYRQISTASISVEALPDTNAASNTEGIAAVVSTPLPLKAIPDGGSGTGSGAGFWLLWLLPPLAGGAVLGGVWVWQQIGYSRMMYRKQRALQTALQQLEGLSDAEKHQRDRVLTTIMNALNTYMNAKLGAAARRDIRFEQLIESSDIPELVRQQLIALMRVIQEGTYAPAECVVIDTLLGQTRDALIEVDALW